MDYDVIIVGGSFAGLSAAMQLARARRRIVLIDGGQPRNRFAAHSHGFLGQDGKAPHDIVQQAREQLAQYPSVTFVDGDALNAGGESGRFEVLMADGQPLRAKRLILATGLRDELPGVPGLQERWGQTVLHCPYCHGYETADRPLGVMAAHPMSAHQAVLLPDWGPTTYFTQGQFEPDAEQAALMAKRGVRIERSPIVELMGASPRLDAVKLADGRRLAIHALFVASKTHMASPLAMQLGCAFNDGPLGPIIGVDDLRQTSVPGVFAAGDAAIPMSNATLASASGVMAGVCAHRSLVME
ncbi:MAG: NAD(P)/FAD-dependent oxidoreductase [Achromobacter sp.]|uniref:NAD(P)/FAD-dependent oxidoreductase n=1 Tax=unclassified Achromobacter TaxID=2626865 RepID=UPI000E75A480|nr:MULTISPECIES: NAD(P)/FAD-dependent oxidoreductase [unclassified Achromobacter]AYD64617.1 NAD(P)/FAD-dependent oxidoreductase [Achromobacter sp. B7]MDX3983906.1 NAD(P)/FAD-dependent oxidoreductase [Achromobacter sp.]